MTTQPIGYSVAQTAALLNLHPETIRRMIARGQLRAIKMGKAYLVSADHIADIRAQLNRGLDRSTDPAAREPSPETVRPQA